MEGAPVEALEGEFKAFLKEMLSRFLGPSGEPTAETVGFSGLIM